MEQKQLRDLEALCIQEEAPACESSCSLHVEARTFIKLMAEQRVEKARQHLDRTLPLSCLTAFLCEGPCQSACRRAELDQGIAMPMLERACVLGSSMTKIMSFPSTGKRICVVGTGISSLVVAFEMAKKGHNVQIYYINQGENSLGQDIILHAGERLPQNALQEALDCLASLNVEFIPCVDFGLAWLEKCLKENLYIYLGFDDNSVSSTDFDIIRSEGAYIVNSISLSTENSQVLMGGYQYRKGYFIDALADAKKAIGSLNRLLQGVSPETAREKEETYKTKLYTDITSVQTQTFTSPINPLLPTKEEAVNEALRCIQCSCMECVKQCSFLRHFKAYPKKYLREVYNNLSIVQGLRQSNTMINACAECGLCAKICPNGLNMGEFFAMAREEMVATKRMPPSAHEFALEDMCFSNSDKVQFLRHQEKSVSSAYMFFPGCQLPATLPKQVEQVYKHLQKSISEGVGIHFACCGSPAAWAGRLQYRENTVRAFQQKWEEAGKPTYILACASCSEFFTNYCPEIPHVSLWEILVKYPLSQGEGQSFSQGLPKNFAIHDPCASRTFPHMQESVRCILKSMQQETTELEYGRDLTRCCGYGGLASEAHRDIADGYAEERFTDTEQSLVVYCAICRERMQKKGNGCLHLLELLFPSENIEADLKTSFLSMFERQDKRLAFREHMLKEFWSEQMAEKTEDNYILHIADDVMELLNQRRIQRSDIIAILKDTEENGAPFYNKYTGHSLAYYRPRQVTYWLEYQKEEDNSYRVFDSYCHRMLVPGVTGEGEAPCFERACCVESVKKD